MFVQFTNLLISAVIIVINIVYYVCLPVKMPPYSISINLYYVIVIFHVFYV